MKNDSHRNKEEILAEKTAIPNSFSSTNNTKSKFDMHGARYFFGLAS